MTELVEIDHEFATLLKRERIRQNTTIQLIPSQSTVVEAVLKTQGAIFTMAIEGYPGWRYFPGCGLADDVERLVIERAKVLFGAEHANVQPHSGVSADIAIADRAAEWIDDAVRDLAHRECSRMIIGDGSTCSRIVDS